MSWADYGFTQNDLALFPVDRSVKGFNLALKERFELMHFNPSNNRYIRLVDCAENRWTLLVNNRSISTGRYNFLLHLNDCFKSLRPSSNATYWNVSGSYFLTQDEYDYVVKTIRGINRYFEDIVDELIASGFNTSFLTFTDSVSQLTNIMAYSYTNKHWAIQMYYAINKLRYAMHHISSGALNYIYTFGKRNSNSNYQTLEESLQSLTIDFINLSGGNDAYSYFPLIILYYKNGSFYIRYLAEYFLIKKSYLDSLESSFFTGTQNACWQFREYSNFFSESLSIPFWCYVDKNNIVTYENESYYKINCTFDKDSLIDIIRNNTNYKDDSSPESSGYLYYMSFQVSNRTYEMLDGLNTLQFLDIA